MSDSQVSNLVSQIAKGISNLEERVVLGIDGVDASGKSFFAQVLYQELNRYWDYSIFLKVDFDIALQRNVNREIEQRRIGGREAVVTKYKKRYQPGQQLYLRESQPEDKANIVIDNSDFTHPVVLKDSLNWTQSLISI